MRYQEHVRRLLALVVMILSVAGLTGCGGALRAGPDKDHVSAELKGAERDMPNLGLPLADGRPRPVSGLMKLCATTPLTIIKVRFSQAAIEVVDAKLYERKKVTGKDVPHPPETALAPGGTPAVGATVDRLCRDTDADTVVDLDVLVRRAKGFGVGAYGTVIIEYVTNGQHHWGSLEYPIVIGYPSI